MLTALVLLALTPLLVGAGPAQASKLGTTIRLWLSLILTIATIAAALRLNGHRRLLSPLVLFVLLTMGMLYAGSLLMLAGYERAFVVRLSPALLLIAESLLVTCIGACVVEQMGAGQVKEFAAAYLARPVEDLGDKPAFMIWTTLYTLIAAVLTPALFLASGVSWHTSATHDYGEITRSGQSISGHGILVAGAVALLPIAALFRVAAALCSRRREDEIVALLMSCAVVGTSILAGIRYEALDYFIWVVILILLLGRSDLLSLRHVVLPAVAAGALLIIVPVLRDPTIRHSSAHWRKALTAVIDRVFISETETLNFQVNAFGNRYSYFNGGTYEDQILSLLHIAKPHFSLPRWIPQHDRQGVTYRYGDVPFVPPTFIGEAYANFGLAGTLVVSFAMGCLLQWYWRRLLASRRRLDGMLFAAMLIDYFARVSVLGALGSAHTMVLTTAIIFSPRWAESFGLAVVRATQSLSRTAAAGPAAGPRSFAPFRPR